tara:strand:+ start:1206 stop:1727 length:522 start_codon:yes stop_codon:yes gene_type:complete
MLNTFDILVYITLFFFILLGFFRGGIKEISSFFLYFIVTLLSFKYMSALGEYFYNYEIIKNLILDYFSDNYIIYAKYSISFLLILSTSFALVFFIRELFFSKIIIFNNFILNRFLGAFFGFFKACLFIIIFTLLVDQYYSSDITTIFGNNSLWLEFFYNYSVQLENVWDYWNS